MKSKETFREEFKKDYDKRFDRVFERVQKLQEALLKRSVPAHIAWHFREACNCFRYGLYQASIMMLRSTLEIAYRYRLAIEKDKELNGDKEKVERYLENLEKRGSLLQSFSIRVRKIGF